MLHSCCYFCNFLKFQFMPCFVSYAGAVAPVLPVRETLRLVLLVVNVFFVEFYTFCGVLCFALILISVAPTLCFFVLSKIWG